MSASIHPFPQAARARHREPGIVNPPTRLATPSDRLTWLVDLGSLAHCRAVLFGRENQLQLHVLGRRAPELAPMDVPPAYERFCRAHFASVRRLHPSLEWDDACPAYAVALSAHAAMCVAFDQEQELLLERHWDRIRGESRLSWLQARPLIAAGCSTLDRLDPLAMNR
ncbi:hypothetical protein BH11PSE14_BH11PSE14_01160 [soil metagenome]